MVDISTDHMDQWKLLDLPKGAEFFDQEYNDSRTRLDRYRQSPVNKSKLADTIRTSATGTTLLVDPDLQILAEINSRWLVRGNVYILGESTNGDIDITLSGPAGVGGFFKVDGSTAKNAISARVEQDTDTTAVIRSIEGIITVGATAGAIGLFWSQHASHADDVIVQAGSHMTFMRMENS